MRPFGIFLRSVSALDKILDHVTRALEGEPVHQNIRYFAAWDLMKFTGVFVESRGDERTPTEKDLIRAYTQRGTVVFIVVPGEKIHTVAGYFKDAPTPVTFEVSAKATTAQWVEAIQEQWDVLIASVPVAESTETSPKDENKKSDDVKCYGDEQLGVMTVDDLKAFAKDKGVELPAKAPKPVIIETLIAANIPLA